LKHHVHDKNKVAESIKHPIHLALQWDGQLQQDPTLTKAQLARKEDLSRARITQVMHLSELPNDIQNFLAQLTDHPEIRFFSERRLRRILSIQTPSLQQQVWYETLEQFKGGQSI